MDPAEQLYEANRQDQNDVEEIAGRTGWKPGNIAKVKHHLFIEIHLLDSYEALGVAPVMARFDADRSIAESWLRLKTGAFTEFDLQLLRHETAEAWRMRKHGPSHRRAHAAAMKRFPAPKELWS